jgi:hypothetical protein
MSNRDLLGPMQHPNLQLLCSTEASFRSSRWRLSQIRGVAGPGDWPEMSVPMVRPVKECPESLHPQPPVVRPASGRRPAGRSAPMEGERPTSHARCGRPRTPEAALSPTNRNVVKGIFPAAGTPQLRDLDAPLLEAAIACHVNHPRRRHAPTYVGAGPVLRGGRKPISRAAWADAGRPWRVGPPRSGAL